MTTATVSDATFQAAVLDAAKPVLLQLSAPWCGPCRAMAPAVAEVAAAYADSVTVLVADLDANPAIAERLAVRGVPLFVGFRNGQEVGRAAGALSKTRLCVFIDAHLATDS